MLKKLFLMVFATVFVMVAKAGVSDDGLEVSAVVQGYQTAGCGNEKTVLLRMDLKYKVNGVKLTAMNVRLKEKTLKNVSGVAVYRATSNEFYAVTTPTKLGEATPTSNNVTIPMDYTVRGGTNYLWLTVTVKDDAQLGDALDAALTSVKYTLNDAEKTLSVGSDVGDPNGSAKIFAVQSIAYAPTSNGCRYYRIPAMILDKEGNIVVAADRRYGSGADLGNHKIDVSVRRSLDGGRSWTAQNIVAAGDGSTAANFGYGDPALARTKSGRLICVASAGSQSVWNGIRYAVITTSDDNGVTWKKVRHIYTSKFRDEVHGLDNKFGFFSSFISSGKGLTTRDGTVMFTTNCLTNENRSSFQCYLLSSTDEGNSWTLGPGNAYPGCDESKLEQLNNGDLMVSVRQSGARGFNTGSADGKMWDSPWRNSQIWGNACNGDILYYSRETEGHRDIMLHSYVNSGSRENLTIAMSVDGGFSWQNFMNIQPGSSCYSTMVRLKDGGVGVLYEDASYNADNGYALTYVAITDEQINAFADQLKQNVGEDYQRAIEKLEDGGVYYFATSYLNDVQVRGTYYMKADGRLTTDFSEAKYFTFQKCAVGNGFKPIAWKSGQFTNPVNASTNSKYIRTDAQNRNDWDAQAIFLNADGLYAIRATNAATENQWGSNAYWTTDAQGNATYDLAGKPHYIWKIVKVGTTPRFDPTKTYRVTTEGDLWWSVDSESTLKLTQVLGNSHGLASIGGTPISVFTILPAANVKGGFTLQDEESGKFVGAPTGNNWTTGTSAATLRIIQLDEKLNDYYSTYMIQAPFAQGYANAAGNVASDGMRGTVVSSTKNESDTYWHINVQDDPAGISDAPKSGKSAAEAVFSADGVRLRQLQKGLNIVRRADGSIQKLFINF